MEILEFLEFWNGHLICSSVWQVKTLPLVAGRGWLGGGVSFSTTANQSMVSCTVPMTNTSLVSLSVADPDPGSGAFLTPGSGIRDG